MSSTALATPGDTIWVRGYNGPGNSDDGATALAASPDGSKVFVTGQSLGSGTGYLDYATVAYDASTGAKIWTRRYNGTGNSVDRAYALAASPDGSKVFVTGESLGSGTGYYDYATIAYDASTGATVWVKRQRGPGNSNAFPYALAVSPDGMRVYVTGDSASAFGTVAYDSSTGAKIWAKRYSGPEPSNAALASALAVSPDGTSLFVTGYSTATSASDYDTVAYDASTGAEIWTKQYSGPGTSFESGHRRGGQPRRIHGLRDRLQPQLVEP